MLSKAILKELDDCTLGYNPDDCKPETKPTIHRAARIMHNYGIPDSEIIEILSDVAGVIRNEYGD